MYFEYAVVARHDRNPFLDVSITQHGIPRSAAKLFGCPLDGQGPGINGIRLQSVRQQRTAIEEMVSRFDRTVSPTCAVVGVGVPQRSLYLTPRIVVVHVIGSVQADLDNGPTPGFLQPDARHLCKGIRLQVQQPGSIIEGLN